MRRVVVFVSLFYILLAFAVYTSLTGCATVSNQGDSAVEPRILEPQLSIGFTDIPLPSGFKFLSRHSYSFQSGDVRMAVLKYSGRPGAGQAFNFFKQQMPIYNWVLMNTAEYGTRLLNFENEQESCIITIVPKSFRTEITISIGPKQSISKGKSKAAESKERAVK